MKKPPTKEVAAIRSNSQTLARELEFMHREVTGIDLSPSAIHAIVTIGTAGTLRANTLRSLLLLEKSIISRLIRDLLEKGLINRMNSKSDARIKLLRLSNAGRQLLQVINANADARISLTLAHLDPSERATVLQGIKLYSESLTSVRKKMM